MSAINTILSHRSIRKFKSDPIPANILDDILNSAIRTSTTGNMQVYSIIVNQDLEKRKALLPFHFGQKMVEEAPLLLTFCADFNRFNKWCEQRDAEPGYDNFLSFMTAAIDGLIAAQNASIAAESHGLGICYLGTTTYMADKLIEFFNCPEGVVPLTTLVIGYPDEQPPLTDRLPKRAVVHMEKYQDFTSAEIDSLYEEKENLPLTHQLLDENQVETLAQVFTQKRYTKKDNVAFSKAFLEVIRKQGFWNH